MNVEEELLQIIEQASSPSSALAAAAAAIARDELSDACGVFLGGPEGRLSLWARSDPGFEHTRETAESVARESLARVGPAHGRHAGQVLIAAPLLSHARPIGALVVERREDQPYAPGETRRLVAIASHIVGIVESARLIDMLVHAREVPAQSISLPPPRPAGERTLQGHAASPGIAIGGCVFRQTFPRSLLRLDVARQGPDAERGRWRDAVEKTRNDLKRLQRSIAGELGEEQALIFGSHLLFLADPLLLEGVEQGIAQGVSAAVAVDRAQSEIIARLNLVGDAYIRERIEDLEDLGSRLLSHLLGASSDPEPRAELVMCARITPSLVVELHARGTLGIASELGGSTSHAVLLARALGIPAVTGITGLLAQAVTGEPLLIDGDRGRVVVAPSDATLAEYRALLDDRERIRTEFAVYRDRPTVTADGHSFALRANVAFGVDIDVAHTNNADGIGLYRTEFPFIVRDGIPTLEEQARIYGKACQAFVNRPVVFRILDVAADKLVAGSALRPSSNAFNGYRSIRLLLDHPHILRDQVQAFGLAAAHGPLSIMIPMVSSLEELRRVKALIADALAAHAETAASPPPRIGVLIEVPAAVEIAGDLARESDFIAIGTNDLVQYALVIDRDDSRLSTPLDAYHPGVLRMVRRVVVAAHALGKEVSVCGEIASNYELACALLALDVDALSVTPRAIPELKQRLARFALAPLQRDMQRILALGTASELRQAISDFARV